MVSLRETKSYVPLDLRFNGLIDESFYYNTIERKWYKSINEKETEAGEIPINNSFLEEKYKSKPICLKPEYGKLHYAGNISIPSAPRSKIINKLIELVEGQIKEGNKPHSEDRLRKISVAVVRGMFENKR